MTAVLTSLGYALAIGLLIGLERGWRERDALAGTRVAGWRTFGLLGLLGGMAARVPLLVAAAGLLVTGAILLVGYARQSQREDTRSATSSVAAILTLLLGLAAGLGFQVEALAAAAVVTLLLSARKDLHRWLLGMNEAEARSVARFALIALVLLPLLPDRAMGPASAWNPRQLGLVVVLASGLSFLGYVLARRTQEARGILVTAVCGAMVSSTAVTFALARRLNLGERSAGALIGGIVLASAVMFLRVLILSALLVPLALPRLLLLTLPALGLAAFLGWLGARGSSSDQVGSIELGNPLDLGAALGLALLFAIISLMVRLASDHFGALGIAGTLALTGLADVDAAVLALATLPAGSVAPDLLALVLAGPIILNTALKAGLTIVVAPNRNGARAAGALTLCALVSATVMSWLLWAKS
jgi:uncharacterized membrane protein (DUF4010 family)